MATQTSISQLIEMSEKAEKIKGAFGCAGCQVKFFNGKVESFPVELETYTDFAQELEKAGWKLGPQVSGEGFIARKEKSNVAIMD